MKPVGHPDNQINTDNNSPYPSDPIDILSGQKMGTGNSGAFNHNIHEALLKVQGEKKKKTSQGVQGMSPPNNQQTVNNRQTVNNQQTVNNNQGQANKFNQVPKFNNNQGQAHLGGNQNQGSIFNENPQHRATHGVNFNQRQQQQQQQQVYNEEEYYDDNMEGQYQPTKKPFLILGIVATMCVILIASVIVPRYLNNRKYVKYGKPGKVIDMSNNGIGENNNQIEIGSDMNTDTGEISHTDSLGEDTTDSLGEDTTDSLGEDTTNQPGKITNITDKLFGNKDSEVPVTLTTIKEVVSYSKVLETAGNMKRTCIEVNSHKLGTKVVIDIPYQVYTEIEDDGVILIDIEMVQEGKTEYATSITLGDWKKIYELEK